MGPFRRGLTLYLTLRTSVALLHHCAQEVFQVALLSIRMPGVYNVIHFPIGIIVIL